MQYILCFFWEMLNVGSGVIYVLNKIQIINIRLLDFVYSYVEFFFFQNGYCFRIYLKEEKKNIFLVNVVCSGVYQVCQFYFS